MRDVDALTSWHADWGGLRVAVLGLGVTGFSVADTLAELGAEVLVLASSGSPEQRNLLDLLGVRHVGSADAAAGVAALAEFDPELIVVSPGFRPDHPLVDWATGRGVPVWVDVELAWRVRDKVTPLAEWILITGTNGKTTTAQLTAHMLETAGKRVAAVGNIGLPVLDAVRYPAGFDVLVVELSSYQLHWLRREGAGAVSPWASVCLNLAPDHLYWHGSLDAYGAAKETVYSKTRVAAVYNRSDLATMRMVENAEVVEGCRAIGFGLAAPGPSDLGIVEDILCDRAFLEERTTTALELATMDDLAPAGLLAPHSVSNALAAAALARSFGVEPAAVRSALRSFRLDHHRTERVVERDGVAWIDDSKATNPHAAEASLRAFESVVWVVGGLLKGVDVAALVASHVARLRAAVIIGADRGELRAAFERHAPALPVFEVDTADTGEVMPVAVRLAAAVAQPGDVVLLAPAAASMDQFTDYSDRGRRFAAAVQVHLEQFEGHQEGDADAGNKPSRPPV